MLYCSLVCLLLPCCATSVFLRSHPDEKITSMDVVAQGLYGPDGFYHDAEATFEEFGDNDLGSVTPSFCVFSRIIVQELPYVRSFLKHYVQLGVGKFYFVNNMHQQHGRIAEEFETLATDLSTQLSLHSVHVTDADAALQDMDLFHRVEEEYIIGVDVDEYWVLPDGISTFQNLVQLHPAIYYRVQWVMVPNDEIDAVASRPYRGFRGANGKWMAKTDTLEQIAVTPHQPLFADAFAQQEPMTEAGELIHFWGRSFLDQLTKGLAQQLHNRAGEDLDEIDRMLSEGTVPERLQLLAFLSNLDRNMIVGASADLLTIDRDLEKEIAADLLRSNTMALDEEVNKIHNVYAAYKTRIANIMHTGEYPAYPKHGLERISKWLGNVGNATA